MNAIVKNIYLVFIQNPDFENDSEKVWEMAWNRYRQSKRNEEALNLVKHNVTKFHTHSKSRKLFQPITYQVKKQSTPSPFIVDPREIIPNTTILPSRDFEFPPKPEKKQYIEEPEKHEDTQKYPKTAMERFREITRGK